jgi:Ca2+:H+ antiporter
VPRWLYALIALVPLAFLARVLDWSPLLVFALAALGLVPLAGLIGQATEELAHHLGPRVGGLLNATFGNAAELIITCLAINRGLLMLAKASITGSIIGNTLLVLGVGLLAGGFKNGRQTFDVRDASLSSAMMITAIAGLYLPAAFASTVVEHRRVEDLSLFVSAVLLLTYAAYLFYTVVQGHPRPLDADSPAASPTAIHGDAPGGEAQPRWSLRFSMAALAAATVGAAIASEILVDAVEPVTVQLGWSEFFIGVIVVAIVGNAAEHYSAVQMAWKNRLDVSLAIAAGSSTQVALFVAPVLVFLSLLLGHPMDLVFEPLELVVLGLATAIFAYISLDGESNWLEGMQLLALYAMCACAFFFLPF